MPHGGGRSNVPPKLESNDALVTNSAIRFILSLANNDALNGILPDVAHPRPISQLLSGLLEDGQCAVDAGDSDRSHPCRLANWIGLVVPWGRSGENTRMLFSAGNETPAA